MDRNDWEAPKWPEMVWEALKWPDMIWEAPKWPESVWPRYGRKNNLGGLENGETKRLEKMRILLKNARSTTARALVGSPPRLVLNLRIFWPENKWLEMVWEASK